MNTKFKIFIAILVAPLAALASYVLLTLVHAILVKLLTSEVVTFIDVVGNVSVAPYTLAIAYPATLIIGLPTHFFLRLIKRNTCLLYTSPSPRDATLSRMPSSA